MSSHHLLLFIFLVINHHASPVNSTNSSLPVMDCQNGLSVSYPFWVRTNGNQYCGYRGLGLTCEAETVTLTSSSGNKYFVKNIDYSERSITLIAMEVYEDTPCHLPRHDFEFGRERFATALHGYYTDDSSYLRFFYNCSSLLPSHTHQILCPGEKRSYWIFAIGMYAFDIGRACASVVTYPIRSTAVEKLNKSNYWNALQDGFNLNFYTSDEQCGQCERSGGLCCYSGVPDVMDCACKSPGGDILYEWECNGSNGSKALIGIVSYVMAAVVFGVLILIGIYRDKLHFNGKKESDQNVELFFESYESQAPRRYKYSDLKKMTNSFEEKLGQGGFGSVFKGKLFDGCPVAVKVLNESKGTGEEFINEVATISRTNHLNIVSLFGFCFEGSKRALIYEFMANGSLEKFIYDRKASVAHPLGWEKLHQIAVGIARGLEYLHRGCNTRILHFDIKPHNILLDENFFPKISDFGMAKLYLTRESIVSVAGARGTTGYIAPEVCCRNFGPVSYKSDVYSYGMMLLEMVGGRKNIDVRVENTSEIYFPHWIYKKLEEQGHERLEGFAEIIKEEVARKMILVGLWCIQTDPINRPSMSKVVEMLEGNSGSLVMPPNPFCNQISASMSSPPRS